ncbi:gluconate 2-dehydrogenase subunit 3 family protein [Geovibrio ferrireducens]|uniref:gluconate 2-dehydrogenase subunit 3 family protein n=1 Tax=Geovibrio ferrireducens TaxID=46201 RepID=UPI002248144D|nr:gluconate 2-dehydrogenase subunit 3 family protein [Geovibrio ferrireducens]
MSKKADMTRRNFLKATGVAAGVAALSGSILSVTTAETHAAEMKHSAQLPSENTRISPKGKMFFTNELEFATLSEASERIFPKDDNGPGAKELGVPFFIDNQLAGAYGYNTREYMSGPFFKGAPTQGYQTPLLKRDIFSKGLGALNSYSQMTFQKNFPELKDADKDVILKMCESGAIPTDGFNSAYFFSLLRGAVLAGVYADPIYGGNSNMNGWRMKQYPGAQMSYFDIIKSRNFEKIEPVSLADMY